MPVHGIKTRKMENKPNLARGKQTMKQGHKYMKMVKTKAYYVKETKKRKQKTRTGVSGRENGCACRSLRVQA